jgi:hypothetical protein
MKTLICAALLMLTTLSAEAADYFVVVPVKGRVASSPNIQVALAGYPLPGGTVGDAYQGFDFAQVLQVSGDPAYNPAGVRWSIASGNLPAGLVLTTDGKLSGTPTEASTSAFSVRAEYRSKAGEQLYTVVTVSMTISLDSATLPAASAYQAYQAYDFKPLLKVTNDPSFSASAATFAATGLPAGLSLDSTGVLSGTPSGDVVDTTTLTVTVSANYRHLSTTKDYSLALTPESDPYWSKVTYLFNFEGANGAKVLSEPVKGASGTFYNAAQLSTGAAKFGQASLSTTGGYLQLPGSVFSFGRNDFTVEFFFKPAALGGSNMQMVDCRPANSNGAYVSFATRGDGSLTWYSNSADVVNTGAGVVRDASVWHHLAYSRSQGVGRMYVDGNLVGSSADTINYISSASGCLMGKNAFSTAQAGGSYDAMRITVGVGRYVLSSFTPPARAYPTH